MADQKFLALVGLSPLDHATASNIESVHVKELRPAGETPPGFLLRGARMSETWPMQAAQQIGEIRGRLDSLEKTVTSNHVEVKGEIHDYRVEAQARGEDIKGALDTLNGKLSEFEAAQQKRDAERRGFMAGGKTALAMIAAGAGGVGAGATHFLQRLFGGEG